MSSVKFPPYCSGLIVLMNSGGHGNFVPSAAWEEKLSKQGGIFQGMNTFAPHLIDSYLTDTVDGIMQHEIWMNSAEKTCQVKLSGEKFAGNQILSAAKYRERSPPFSITACGSLRSYSTIESQRNLEENSQQG